MKTVVYELEHLPEVAQEDWARLDALSDEDIDFSDIPLQDVNQFVPAANHAPVTISMTLEADVAAYLQAAARIARKTPPQLIGECVREKVAAAV